MADDETAILIFHHLGLDVNMTNVVELNPRERTHEERAAAVVAKDQSKLLGLPDTIVGNLGFNVAEDVGMNDTIVGNLGYNVAEDVGMNSWECVCCDGEGAESRV